MSKTFPFSSFSSSSSSVSYVRVRNGIDISYRLVGLRSSRSLPIVFTPGGQGGMDDEDLHFLLEEMELENFINEEEEEEEENISRSIITYNDDKRYVNSRCSTTTTTTTTTSDSNGNTSTSCTISPSSSSSSSSVSSSSSSSSSSVSSSSSSSSSSVFSSSSSAVSSSSSSSFCSEISSSSLTPPRLFSPQRKKRTKNTFDSFVGLLWDRRNCGVSDICFCSSKSEVEYQVDDLFDLLKHLNLFPAILVGCSSGARLSLLFAKHYPQFVSGLVLVNMTGGRLAATTLSSVYYGQHVDMARKGGMKAVVSMSSHFNDLARRREKTKEAILRSDVNEFTQAMKKWSEWVMNSKDFPVIGINEKDLKSIQTQVLVVHTFGKGVADGMHTYDVNRNLANILPNCQFVASTRNEVWNPKIIEFWKSIAKNAKMEEKEETTTVETNCF